jgi:hypothetical protein
MTTRIKTLALALAFTGFLTAPLMYGAPAQALPTRTWVSGVGNDANDCSRTFPCLTWAGAISKTAAGGEIDALDAGGFGSLTITKAITIDGGGGQVASTLASGGVNGITVNAGTSDAVIIRNLRINGTGGGNIGISFVAGRMVSIENCTIFGFGAGISVTTSTDVILNVTNSNITNSSIGIRLSPSAATVNGQVDHTTLQKFSGNGIQAFGAVVLSVSNSNILNAAVAGIVASAGTVLNVDSSAVDNNNTAFAALFSGFIRITRNTIYDNSNNFTISAGGTIASAGNNFVAINGATIPNATVPHE